MPLVGESASLLRSPSIRQRIAHIATGGDGAVEAYTARCEQALSDFAELFGRDREVAVVSAPGRTEIGGNHTDHQNGCVLAAGIDLDMLAVASTAGGRVVRLASGGEPVISIDLEPGEPVPADRFSTAGLVRGVAASFMESGWQVGGLDLRVVSDVPRGSGLSSSAAFESLIGAAFNALYCDGKVDPVDLARFGQEAENRYFGKPCGLMDQLACSAGGVLAIDFRQPDAPKLDRIAIHPGFNHTVCIIDSGGDHAGLSEIYAEIPEEMCRVAGLLGAERMAFVQRDEFFRRLPELRGQAGDRAVLRAWHFLNETGRARHEADALAAGRVDDFLALVRESGRSSAFLLQNIHPAGAVACQSVTVALAVCEEFLAGRGACRVHGGGFAGTVQAFVPDDRLTQFVRDVESVLGTGACRVVHFRPVGGVRLL